MAICWISCRLHFREGTLELRTSDCPAASLSMAVALAWIELRKAGSAGIPWAKRSICQKYALRVWFHILDLVAAVWQYNIYIQLHPVRSMYPNDPVDPSWNASPTFQAPGFLDPQLWTVVAIEGVRRLEFEAIRGDQTTGTNWYKWPMEFDDFHDFPTQNGDLP